MMLANRMGCLKVDVANVWFGRRATRGSAACSGPARVLGGCCQPESKNAVEVLCRYASRTRGGGRSGPRPQRERRMYWSCAGSTDIRDQGRSAGEDAASWRPWGRRGPGVAVR